MPVPSYVADAVSGRETGYLFDVPRATFNQQFRKAATAAGLTGFRAHDLRHVFASVALGNGMPITDVSRFLGHRSIEITYRIYSHYIPDSFGRATEILNQEYLSWSATRAGPGCPG